MSNEKAPVGAGFQTETFEFVLHSRAGRFYWLITGYPKVTILLALLVLVTAISFLPKLKKDTSAEAFIAPDHPSIVYRKKVDEIFGLSDPVILAVVNDRPGGIFTPASLNLVRFLTREVQKLDGVNRKRVVSLTTQNNIVGDPSGIIVEPFYDTSVETQEHADKIKTAVYDIPLYVGSLVSKDGTATVIVAELLDPDRGFEVFERAQAIAAALPKGGERLYVAGEGAVAEYLGHYVDNDARRLYPIIVLVIIAILFIAFRSTRGIVLPMLVVLSAVPIALGSMAAAGVPYYIITSALPVILIATGVADSIHIVGEYYEDLALRPNGKQRELVVRTMTRMWHPVMLTILTDAIGFLALAFSPSMPPMRAFGMFSSIGVAAACAFSLIMLPAVLTLFRPRLTGTFKKYKLTARGAQMDWFAKVMSLTGNIVRRYPRAILGAAAVVAIVGVVGALKLEINYARIDYFNENEPIRQADDIINERLNGTTFLDIFIETPAPEGLFNPDCLNRMDALQVYAQTLPHVTSAVSIVDYLKQMNRALNDNKPEFYTLPQDENQVAQYLLLYSATGDPADFEEEVDYDYRLANIRIVMNSGHFSDIAAVVEPMSKYIDEHFKEGTVKATIAGRANVTYHWVKDLASGHFTGVVMTLFAVGVASIVGFRSFWAGMYTLVPVTLSVLAIYAFMGFFNIWLGVGTSMFATIAIGISVNFALHTMDRVLELVREYGDNLEHALQVMYPSTGRSLFFNFMSVTCGFSVLMTSHAPPLTSFGLLVAVAVAISFVGSITVLPAMLLAFRPAFLRYRGIQAKDLEAAKVTIENW